MKTRNFALLALAAGLLMLSGTVAQAVQLPTVKHTMPCTLSAFQQLRLTNVTHGDKVTFDKVVKYKKGDEIGMGYTGDQPPGHGSPYYAHSNLCAVYGNIGPGTHTGNNFVLYLPMNNWTQRYVQEGCGGLCGNANLGDPQQVAGLKMVTRGQLALGTTDMGHESQGGDFVVNNPNAGIDFAYRGVHDTALVAKAVIRAFYGQKAKYTYFDGCSDGGREALMEAQRYPKDFDGIAAGSPANNMDVQNTYHHANRYLVNQTTPGVIPTAHDTWVLFSNSLPYIHAKVLAACDGLDGIMDGIIRNPTKCHFNPASLVCGYVNPDGTVNNDLGCLTRAQANVVRLIHKGAVSLNGTRLEPRVPNEWGSELDWNIFVPDSQGQQVMAENFVDGWLYATVINDPTYFGNPPDVNNLDWTVQGFQDTVASSMLYSATNPNLSQFKDHGGKLIYWAGWADQHISPRGTIQYWMSVNNMLGAGVTKQFARLYMFPGMAHCGDDIGPADGNNFDVLGPLMKWVENGKAPGKLIVTGNYTTRPVYPFPYEAKYVGPGANGTTLPGINDDTNNPNNFKPVFVRSLLNLNLSNAGDYLYSPAFPQINCVADGTLMSCDNGSPNSYPHNNIKNNTK